VTLPSGGNRRERFATPTEAKALLAVLPEQDRAVWATAFYAGLRRGELMALRDQAIDLKAGEIRVHAGWTPRRASRKPRAALAAPCR
jgi:integrase